MREKKDINIEIGGNIQVAREQAGYTQDTLSEMLGMTPNHLSAIERRFPGIQTSAEIDTYFRAKEETAQGIQSLWLVNLRRSEACNHRLFRPLTVYTSMPCGRSADRR